MRPLARLLLRRPDQTLRTVHLDGNAVRADEELVRIAAVRIVHLTRGAHGAGGASHNGRSVRAARAVRAIRGVRFRSRLVHVQL